MLLLVASLLVAVQAVQPAQAPVRDGAATKGTASIKGRVTAADTGRPVRRVQVRVSSPDLTEAKSMSTTAEGVFEFKDLPAGRYTISATRPGYLTLQYGQRRPGEPGRPVQLADGERIANADIALPRTSTISGRVTDEVGDPLPAVSIFPAQWKYFRGKRQLVRVSGGIAFNETDETGQFRITGLEPGDYFVMGTTRSTWTVDGKPNERIGFLPTFAPGTANAAEALRVKVGVGQDVNIGDFPLVPGRVATIAGTAVKANGQPLAGETVNRSQVFEGPGSSSSFGMAGAKVNPDGTFLIKDVAPGEYRLTIRAPAEKGSTVVEGATVTVSVMGEDVSGVMLVAGSGGSLSGRVVTDTGAPLAMSDQQRMRVSARPLDPSSAYSHFDNDNGRVRDDGTFEVIGVFGASKISVGPLAQGWALKSIEYQGKDFADMPVDVRGGERLEGLTVVLSKSLPALRGTLLDQRNQPAEGTVLLFPDDPRKWAEESRLTRTVRPDLKGAFEFRNVIPGDYLIVPLAYVREGEWADPEFLENLRERAKRVRVEESGASAVALVLPSER